LSFFDRLLAVAEPGERLAEPKTRRLYHPKFRVANRRRSWNLAIIVPWFWPRLLGDYLVYLESEPFWTAMAAIDRGIDHVERGQFEEAIGEFTKALQLAWSSSVAFFERGRAYWYVGRFQEAAGDLLRAAQSNPEDPEWLFHIYYLLGDSYRQIGNHKMALLNLGIAIGQRPDAAAYVSRGWAYLGKNDLDRAGADFGEAVRLDPSLRTAVPFVPRSDSEK
jgi:tetratricopeptide (TPR) repeat protein